MTQVVDNTVIVRNCLVTGKRVMTRRQAARAASWWRRAVDVGRMTHYRCRACGSWHIANVTSKPRRGR